MISLESLPLTQFVGSACGGFAAQLLLKWREKRADRNDARRAGEAAALRVLAAHRKSCPGAQMLQPVGADVGTVTSP